MSGDTVEILVEIRYERPLSLGIIPAHEIDPLWQGNERLVWLPRAEIKYIERGLNNFAALTVPRWLAEAERLMPETENHSDQGSLL